MTILEKLREKSENLRADIDDIKNIEVIDLLNDYDLALENALLKLGNRGVQIADLKARLNTPDNVMFYILKNAEVNIMTRDKWDTMDKQALARIDKLTK